MAGTPMLLEDALRFNGYTVEPFEYEGETITTPSGPIVVPPMILSRLVWNRAESPSLGAAFYLDRLNAFDPKYRPVQLSMILDHYRTRRLGYDTPDDFGLAVRRWGNLNLGPMSTLIRRYLSVATDLPLTDVDMVRIGELSGSAGSLSKSDGSGTSEDKASSADTSTSKTKGRDAQSDFPQAMIAGDVDYASGAVDRVADGSVSGSGTTTAIRSGTDHRTDTSESSEKRDETTTERGRSGRSVMELLSLQREAFINADRELVEAMESLFLGVYDRSENYRNVPGGYSGYAGYSTFGW